MRAILALICLFCGLPNDVAEDGFCGTQEPKVEQYRVLLSELASSGTAPAVMTPIDLPEDLKEAIKAWKRG